MRTIFYFLSIIMLVVLIFTNIVELINSGAVVRAFETAKDLFANYRSIYEFGK